MKVTRSAASILLCLGLYVSINADTYRAANTYGSVEPIANDAVIDTAPPPIAVSARFFRLVGRIDNELFATDTSGYTQYGRAYLALQSDVPDEQFIQGYTRAASIAGLEYTPLVNGLPALFQGGAAFPSNDWTANPGGEEYLARIPADSHRALARIRAFHLRVTQEVLRKLDRRDDRSAQRWHESDAGSFDCR